jgi:hypothetical protein
VLAAVAAALLVACGIAGPAVASPSDDEDDDS